MRKLFFPPTITPEEARERAWDHKGSAFGALTKLWARPKPEEITISYSEMRYEPLWHVVCRTRYVYDRQREYRLEITDPEVEAFTIAGERRGVVRKEGSGYIMLRGVEHCLEEGHQEKLLDAQAGEEHPQWVQYLDCEAQEIEDLEGFAPEGVFVMPPQIRASSIVREILSEMLRPVQADQMFEELVQVERVDLYTGPSTPSNTTGNPRTATPSSNWMGSPARSTAMAGLCASSCRV